MGERERAAGILLAAGESSRMGSPKQLLPAGRETLLHMVLKEVLDSRLDRVVLVLGHRAPEIRKTLESLLADPKLVVVENGRYREGISLSIIGGLAPVEEDFDHVMILLADMPRIHSGLIDLLLASYLESRLPMGAVTVKGRRSHPVIFSRRYFGELHDLTGDKGARGLFERHKGEVCLVEADACFDDRDIDTPEDYLAFQRSLQPPPSPKGNRPPF